MGTMNNSRPWQSGARLLGGIVLGVIGFGMLALGVVVVAGSVADGAVLAAFGWILLVTGVASVVRAASDISAGRQPLKPTLSDVEGEPALWFPRRRSRGAVAAWTLAALAIAPMIGAIAAFVTANFVAASALLMIALLLLWVASPHQVDPGGMWLTPSRVIHRHDGTGWQVEWNEVRGAAATEPFGIAVRERPRTKWAVSQLRRWTPIYKHDNLWIDGRDMAGDAGLRYYVILKAIADPGFRGALGTPASLPPEGRASDRPAGPDH
jgi:hypothetical protein